jgi:hypothetical protein
MLEEDLRKGETPSFFHFLLPFYLPQYLSWLSLMIQALWDSGQSSKK